MGVATTYSATTLRLARAQIVQVVHGSFINAQAAEEKRDPPTPEPDAAVSVTVRLLAPAGALISKQAADLLLG